jgi:hypothetical protein
MVAGPIPEEVIELLITLAEIWPWGLLSLKPKRVAENLSWG